MNTNAMLIIIWLLISVALMPIAAIWALNLLFNLSIDYTFYTWLAILILSMAVGGSKITQNS